jgi:hypothetical protein
VSSTKYDVLSLIYLTRLVSIKDVLESLTDIMNRRQNIFESKTIEDAIDDLDGQYVERWCAAISHCVGMNVSKNQNRSEALLYFDDVCCVS